MSKLGKKVEAYHYLEPYDIILAHRIRETILSFQEGLARYFPAYKVRRSNKEQRRKRQLIVDALVAAKRDRIEFLIINDHVPVPVLAKLFGVTKGRIYQLKRTEYDFNEYYSAVLGSNRER